VYLDLSMSSQEQSYSKGSSRSLNYTVIANRGHSLDVDINGIPEMVSSDRVRPTQQKTALAHKSTDPTSLDVHFKGSKPVSDQNDWTGGKSEVSTEARA